MALCRFQTIRLLKCEERGPVSAGDGGVGKARLKLRHCPLSNFPLDNPKYCGNDLCQSII